MKRLQGIITIIEKLESKPFLFACVIALLLVIFYLWRPVLFDETPLFSPNGNINDPAPSNLVFGPGSEMVKNTIFHKSSFLWTPTRNFGTPTLYEQYQSGPLHPWSWLRSQFLFTARWQINAIIILFIITLAHLVLARNIFGFTWIASTVFAQIGTLNAFFLRNLNHQYLVTYASAIWMFYFISLSLTNQKRTYNQWITILLGEVISLGLSMLAGFPEAFFPIMLIILITYVATFFSIPKKNWLTSVVVVIIASITSMLLTSYQLLAFLEGLKLQGDNFRGGLGLVSLPWEIIGNLLNRYDNQNRVFYYTGSITFFLVIFSFPMRAWRHTNRTIGLVFGISALFFLIHVFNVFPPLHNIIGSLPIFNVSNFYGYFPPLFILGIAWLASGSIEKFMTAKPNASIFSNKIFLMVVVLFFVSELALTSITIKHSPEVFNYLKLLRLLPSLIIIFLFTFFWLFIKNPKTMMLFKVPLALSVIVLLVVELGLSMNGFRYSKSKEVQNIQFGEGYEQVVNLTCNKRDTNSYRLAWIDKITPGFCIANPDSAASATPLKRNDLLKQILFNRNLILEQPRFSYSLQMISTRWYGARSQEIQVLRDLQIPFQQKLGLPNGWTLTEITNVLPRAYLANTCQTFIKDESVAAYIEKGKYTLGEALVETDNIDIKSWCDYYSKPREASAIRNIDVVEDTGDAISLANVRGPGVLVFNDSFYPGWEAYTKFSNEHFEIFPVNLAFKGIFLKEDKDYQIIFKYNPPWIILARIGTLLGVIVLGLIVVVFRFKNR